MHLRFGDSDDDGPGPSGAAPAAVPAAAGIVPPAPAAAATQGPFHCVSTVRTDFDAKDTCYVFELAHSPGSSLVAAALSNKLIKLFNFRWAAGGQRRLPVLCCAAWLLAVCGRALMQPTAAAFQPVSAAVTFCTPRLPMIPLHPGLPTTLCTPASPRRSDGGLSFVGDLVGHEGMLRELHFDLPEEPHLLHSCGADGTVRGWDTRSGQQVEW